MTQPIDSARLNDILRSPASLQKVDMAGKAFQLQQAIETMDLPRKPDQQDMARLLPQIQDLEAVMISAPALAEVRHCAPLTADPEDGAVIVFSDLTVLWFDEENNLGEHELHPEQHGVSWPHIAPGDSEAELLASTPAFQVSHGASNEAILASEDEDDDLYDWWMSLQLCVEDAFDPPIGSSADLPSEQRWDDGDEEHLQKEINHLFHAFSVKDDCELTLLSACMGTPHDLHCEPAYLQPVAALLTHLADLTCFYGVEYEPGTDGDPDRLSGYVPSPIISSYSYDPEDNGLSNHEQLTSPEKVLTRLREGGASQDMIEAARSCCLR